MTECLKAIDLKDAPTGPALAYLNLYRKAQVVGMSVTDFEGLPRDKAEMLFMAALHDREALRAEQALVNEMRTASA